MMSIRPRRARCERKKKTRCATVKPGGACPCGYTERPTVQYFHPVCNTGKALSRLVRGTRRSALICTILLLVAEAASATPPNILLILTDDQGWGDLGVHGNDVIETPHLDALAHGGTRFNHFYVSPVCAPTRASLLTGRHHLRSNVTGVTDGREVMNAEEITLAEALKDGGYATGCFGKWHNGGHYPHDPNGQGFEEFFGFCGGHWNNYFDTLYQHNSEMVRAEGYINDVVTDKAIDFMTANQARPFLCYVPYNTPHSPFQVPDKYFDKYKVKGLDDKLACVYAMCENLDDNVGRMVNALEKLGLRDNTIILYLGDNGPNTKRYVGGMRGHKGTVHEGGVRNMLLMNGPGLVPGDQVVEPLAAHIDLFPTLLSYAGVALPEGVQIDGRDLRPLIDRPNTTWEERDIYSHWRVRAGLRTASHRLAYQKDKASLFDLRVDPGEQVDIAPLKPVLFAQLKARYETWYGEVTDGVSLEAPPIPIGYTERPQVELLAPEGKSVGNVAYDVRAGWANDWFTHWTDTDAHVYWDLNNVRAGDYEVTLNYICAAADVGAEFAVDVAGTQIRGKIVEGHDPAPVPSPDREPRIEVYEKVWKPLAVGTLRIPEGETRLTVRALTKPGETVMNLKSVVLKRK
jgi:arylsulfatase A-like enzyme